MIRLITKIEFKSWYNSSMGILYIYFPESTESLLKLHNTLDRKGDLTIIWKHLMNFLKMIVFKLIFLK
jgi:hypothetical protein